MHKLLMIIGACGKTESQLEGVNDDDGGNTRNRWKMGRGGEGRGGREETGMVATACAIVSTPRIRCDSEPAIEPFGA